LSHWASIRLGWLFHLPTCNRVVDLPLEMHIAFALTCPKANMQSVDGSERADTLLLKRFRVEYRDTTGLRLEHGPQRSHSKELFTTPSPHAVSPQVSSWDLPMSEGEMRNLDFSFKVS